MVVFILRGLEREAQIFLQSLEIWETPRFSDKLAQRPLRRLPRQLGDEEVGARELRRRLASLDSNNHIAEPAIEGKAL